MGCGEGVGHGRKELLFYNFWMGRMEDCCFVGCENFWMGVFTWLGLVCVCTLGWVHWQIDMPCPTFFSKCMASENKHQHADELYASLISLSLSLSVSVSVSDWGLQW